MTDFNELSSLVMTSWGLIWKMEIPAKMTHGLHQHLLQKILREWGPKGEQCFLPVVRGVCQQQ